LRNTKKYRKTPKGVLTNLYNKQKERSKKRGFPMPDYSLKWLHETFLQDKLFLLLFRRWADRGYRYYDKPSIDRIDSKKPYRKDNIQILTWEENRKKGDNENKSITTEVVMCNMDGKEIKTFPSIKSAVLETGVIQSGISMCCCGKRKHSGGYTWKYGKHKRK